MTGKNRIYLIIISILFFSLVSTLVFAEMIDYKTIRFYGQQGTNLSVRDTCTTSIYSGGFPCDNTYACNFTILNPDQTFLINQSEASRIGDYWNYTLNEIQTSILGIYEVTTYCNNVSNAETNTFYYQITKDGNSIPSGIFSIFLILGILGITGLFVYMSISLDDVFYYIKFLFLLLSIILFSIAFYILREIAITNYPTTLGNILDIVFWVYLYIMLFILMVTLILFIVGLFKKDTEEQIYE